MTCRHREAIPLCAWPKSGDSCAGAGGPLRSSWCPACGSIFMRGRWQWPRVKRRAARKSEKPKRPRKVQLPLFDGGSN
jgi:hypothetical protein